MSLQQKGQEKNTVQTSLETETLREGWFDCNICLDTAHEPVVTQCGHLYCWGCVYEWLSGHRRSCPVCKISITMDCLVPLYGRGAPATKKKCVAIPRRPAAAAAAVRRDVRENMLDGYGCVSGMEMVYARVFGMTLMGSPYDAPSGRGRRHEMLTTRSLHRFSLFLFCCVFLCLVLF